MSAEDRTVATATALPPRPLRLCGESYLKPTLLPERIKLAAHPSKDVNCEQPTALSLCREKKRRAEHQNPLWLA